MTHISTSKRKTNKLRNANAKPTDVKDTIRSIKAIDFDGTLAKEVKPYDHKVAGPPIPKTIRLVKKWIKEGNKVVIFTSRVSPSARNNVQIRYARKLITAWCKHHLGQAFPITSDKHPAFEYWDNKAHRVETNTGKILAKAISAAYNEGFKDSREHVMNNWQEP